MNLPKRAFKYQEAGNTMQPILFGTEYGFDTGEAPKKEAVPADYKISATESTRSLDSDPCHDNRPQPRGYRKGLNRNKQWVKLSVGIAS
jgi:hypothetical protein